MIVTPTVFILGAGASVPFGYPTAAGLKEKLQLGLSKKDNSDFLNLISCGFQENQIADFRDAFLYSGQLSVDAFLERRPEYIDIGKAAIAQELIRVEHSVEKLFEPMNWYLYLLSRMDCTFEEFGSNQIAFVTFNYDRSLEDFLIFALMYRYGKEIEDVIEMLKTIPIIHVYGKLGDYRWETKDTKRIREFGATSSPDAIKIAAKGIKIVSEKHASESPELQRAHECIIKAKRIFFLGFGYHHENMKRLHLPLEIGGNEYDSTRVFRGLAYYFTDVEKDQLEKKYNGLKIHPNKFEVTLEYLRNEAAFADD